jgi:hypothetical protein
MQITEKENTVVINHQHITLEFTYEEIDVAYRNGFCVASIITLRFADFIKTSKKIKQLGLTA